MAKNKQQNGFTLVEAVVTTAIVALMSALVISGTNGAREKFQVRNAAQQFASDLRETVLLTKNGINAKSCTPGTPRACSSYRIRIINSLVETNEYKRTISSGGSPSNTTLFTLPGVVVFSDIPLNGEIYADFNFSFPSVDVSGTRSFVVKSKNDPSIKSYVCVAPSGAVSIKSSVCP